MFVTGLVGRVVSGNWLSKHALLTAFFPNLAIWTVIVGLFWNGLAPVTTKIPDADLRAVALGFLFVVVVAAMSYFTTNVQPALLRAYRGEWSPNGRFAGIARALRAIWRARVQQIGELDRRLEVQQSERLLPLVGRLEAIITATRDVGPAVPSSPPPTVAMADERLRSSQRRLKRIALTDLSEEDVQLVEDAVADVVAADDIRGRLPVLDEPLAARVRAAAEDAAQRVAALIAAVGAERAWLFDATHRKLPHDTADVGPTRLSNVFRATEQALETRYGLRPSVLTSHLRMVLPAGYAESLLDDAQLGLDLAVTLSALLAVYGLVLAFVLAAMWPKISLFGLLFISQTPTAIRLTELAGLLVVAAPLLGLVAPDRWATRARRYGIYGGFALGMAILVAMLFLLPQIEAAFRAGARIAVFIIVGGVALLGSRLAYLNGVEAAVIYCDGIGTLFDAHRTRILTALRLRVPSRLQDERRLWVEVCKQIERSYTDLDPRVMTFVNDIAVSLPDVVDASEATRALVATRPLAPLTRLRATDVDEATLWPRGDAGFVPVAQRPQLADKVLLCSVASGDPLFAHMLVDATDVAERAVCAVPVSRQAVAPGIATGVRAIVVFPPDGDAAEATLVDLIVVGLTTGGTAAGPALPGAVTTSPLPTVFDATLSVLVPNASVPTIARYVGGARPPLVALMAPEPPR